MKKENTTYTFLTINMIILSIIVLNKNYKTIIEKFSKRYIDLKNKSFFNKMEKRKVQESKMEIYKNFFYEVESVKPNVEDIEIAKLTSKFDYPLISKTVEEFLMNRLKEMQKMEIIVYQPIESFILENRLINPMLLSLSKNEVVFSTPFSLFFTKEKMFPKEFILSIAIIICLNLYYGFSQNIESVILNNSIIEDINQFIDVNFDLNFLNVSQKEETVEIDYHEQFDKILKENIPMYIKLNRIIHFSNADYESIFSYILSINDLSIESKIKTIISSDITNLENISYFLFANSGLSQTETMEYILQYSKATYEEKFELIQNGKFTLEQKIWFSLLIPNSSFQTVFSDLITIDGLSKEILIEEIIKADLISFSDLFFTLFNSNVLTKEQCIYALSFYDAQFNSVTLEEKVNFIFQLEVFSIEEKIEIFWSLLTSYSLEDREDFILSYFNINFQDYISLLRKDNNQLTCEEQIVLQLFEKVNEEKEEYILNHYDFESKEQLDAVVAGVCAEGAWSYFDLYWVSNVFFNRITDPYYSQKGVNPYLQFVAPKQFAVYSQGSYKLYLLSSNSDYSKKFSLAKQAFYDMFYAGYDGIMHDYLSFRSWDTVDYSNNYIVSGGNRYGSSMNVSQRIFYDNLLENKKTTNDLTLQKVISVFSDTK